MNSQSRRKSRAEEAAGAVEVEVESVESSEDQGREVIQVLIAHDAAGEFGKAKTLIQELDGEEFPQEVGEELAVVVGNYFPIQLEPTESGVRFTLVPAGRED